MRILVHLEGGLVQSVSCDEPLDAEVVVIDYDPDGMEPEEIYKVPQGDDSVSEAHLGWHDLTVTDPDITKYINGLKPGDSKGERQWPIITARQAAGWTYPGIK